MSTSDFFLRLVGTPDLRDPDDSSMDPQLDILLPVEVVLPPVLNFGSTCGLLPGYKN